MAFTFCTSAAAIYKAGSNANTAVTLSGGAMDSFSNNAEGMIEQSTNTDFTTNYATLSTSMKNALSEVSSSMVAKNIIAYDVTSYDSQREAETLLDVNDDIVSKGLAILKGKADSLKTP